MSSRIALTIVFISSFCLMVMELVAGRLMAPYLGVSLYTWTSVIGVILGGISLGNYLGGRMADKCGSNKVLGGILLLSGFMSLLVRFMVPFFGKMIGEFGFPLYISTLLFSFFVFFPVSLFLGCISPLVVKLSLHSLEKTGYTVGRVYAFSTLGSIMGTFATGYFLIGLLGTKTIVLAVALVLFVLGILVYPIKRKPGKPELVVGLLFIIGLLMPNNCLEETNYYCINIKTVRGAEDSKIHLLKLDHLVHSYIDLNNINNLEYKYEKVYSILTDYFAKKYSPEFDSFFIGGGGYAMPRYLENNYPSGNIEVTEIDPGVTEINYEKLGLSRDTKIKTINLDARIYLKEQEMDKKYDLIFGDAFNDFSVPYHLTTHEFNQLVKEHLTENGYYIVNIIDNPKHGQFLSAYLKTLKKTFSYVYLAPLSKDWKSARRNTFVVIATDKKLDMDLWNESYGVGLSDEDRNEDKFHFLVNGNELDEFIKEKEAITLTDDYVPLDNLLAPVFVEGY